MSTAAPTQPPIKILIAEDSPTQAVQLQYILEKHGYEVELAGNGRVALEMAQRSPPALVVSDVVMPEMDGYELSRRVKAEPSLSGVPVILVTTMSDPEDVIRGLECGADNFVLKPYEERYLLARVQYALFNREMRQGNEGGMGVEIHFNGRRHFITADRLQILNLLLSTYDAAIHRNKALHRSQEELRVLNTRLEDANKELESFSHSVSHDLRAPLRHIDGYTEMLAEETEGKLSEEATRCLRVIRDASRRMNQLIDDLLAFSRMKRAEMESARVDLSALAREAIANLEMSTRGRDIEWQVAPLPEVSGDPALLRQVLANLLGNAVKYTRPRATARIEVASAGEEDGRTIFFVRDNGVGFDMKYTDKLFGVFQRLHGESEFEGTGIGLANVRSIVARHGGRTWAEAEPDRGATFYFTLKPVAPFAPG